MLSEQLLQQLKNITDLQVALAEEKRCLTEKDFSSFSNILFDKQKLLQNIATLDAQLSIEKTLQVIQQSAELTALKDSVETNLQACQKSNNVNGKLVELSMKSNKHLMQILKQAKGKNSITYDQKGTLNTGRLLGKDIQA
ncbi:flagellar protein FlgN [Psychromonas sp. Urea-02u-13]|uniref:flagellar protein FlgN n=1 Tax=Psychromonas sp. Urea-02u-13 TaxID=2058326 RepID=UPI000C343DCA|nr:flagellar protein FlgN [Psychromonas sp. Urea-02u-13]PKG38613.1 flagellar protein FlgN [Psychromonas sp. Urea-02u-13]